jgi:ribosome-binding protein aMBF1 (putative translation factor)
MDDLHNKWLQNADYQATYDALEDEFALATAVIKARSRAGLTQEELADRMQIKHSVIAQLESGHVMPTTRTLEKIAKATGSRLKISFE